MDYGSLNCPFDKYDGIFVEARGASWEYFWGFVLKFCDPKFIYLN